MVVYALLIINKAGGLVYNRTFHAGLAQLSGNDYLVLAGTFHGIHAISRNLVPAGARAEAGAGTGPARARDATGIQLLQTARFLLSCHQTPTGTKFLLFTEPGAAAAAPSSAPHSPDALLRKCYELYADFVMKNPFYSLEMPIRCDKFERAVQAQIGVVR